MSTTAWDQPQEVACYKVGPGHINDHFPAESGPTTLSGYDLDLSSNIEAAPHLFPSVQATHRISSQDVAMEHATDGGAEHHPFPVPRYQYPSPTAVSTSVSDLKWTYGPAIHSRPDTGTRFDLYDMDEYAESDDEDVFAYLPPTTPEQGGRWWSQCGLI
jgi:hypothetical protein